MSGNSADAVAVTASDNVATLLRAVRRGETVTVVSGGARFEIVAGEDIGFCHKIALADLEPGDRILKYGEPIGEATLRIAAGAAVHVHNMRSLRGRARG